MAKRRIISYSKNKLQRRYFWQAVLVLAVIIIGVSYLPKTTAEPLSNQTTTAKKSWIAQLAPTAQTIQWQTGVLSSISLGQAILESDWGQSLLASRYHNLFGVKSDDPKNSVLLTTSEFQEGSWVQINGRFAVYPSWQASMVAHARLLTHGTTWNAQQYQHVMAARDYHAAAKALVKDGYATDPAYAEKVIELIRVWHLDQYDLPK